MPAKRIIPCLDVTEGRVVKGVKFKNLRDAGDPAELAANYDREGADEIVFLDITASSDARKILLDAVERTADQVFIPLTVGGGVRSVDDMAELLTHGADKVSVNTAALEDPELITRCAGVFGSQCVVLAIDARRHVDIPGWEVYSHGGRRAAGRDAVECDVRVEAELRCSDQHQTRISDVSVGGASAPASSGATTSERNSSTCCGARPTKAIGSAASSISSRLSPSPPSPGQTIEQVVRAGSVVHRIRRRDAVPADNLVRFLAVNACADRPANKPLGRHVRQLGAHAFSDFGAVHPSPEAMFSTKQQDRFWWPGRTRESRAGDWSLSVECALEALNGGGSDSRWAREKARSATARQSALIASGFLLYAIADDPNSFLLEGLFDLAKGLRSGRRR